MSWPSQDSFSLSPSPSFSLSLSPRKLRAWCPFLTAKQKEKRDGRIFIGAGGGKMKLRKYYRYYIRTRIPFLAVSRPIIFLGGVPRAHWWAYENNCCWSSPVRVWVGGSFGRITMFIRRAATTTASYANRDIKLWQTVSAPRNEEFSIFICASLWPQRPSSATPLPTTVVHWSAVNHHQDEEVLFKTGYSGGHFFVYLSYYYEQRMEIFLVINFADQRHVGGG